MVKKLKKEGNNYQSEKLFHVIQFCKRTIFYPFLRLKLTEIAHKKRKGPEIGTFSIRRREFINYFHL